MTNETLTLERAVAQFLVGFSSKDIDVDAREDLKKLIKDQLALQIGASQLPWSKKVRLFRNPRAGGATIVGDDFKASAVDAAYLNATYGHGFEYDDYAVSAHPGCCVVPTAIALGEEVGATLEEILVAMVVGYETYVRIGLLAEPALAHAGWQAHSVLANFGAAAIAAKLYRLDEEQTLHALAIALSHAGGTSEYTSTGGSIKRVHAGMSVRNGIEAAQMARAGITGPNSFLVGGRGFFRMFTNRTIGEEACAKFLPGADLQLRNLSFKAYCCCAANAAYIEAMASVRDRVADIVAVDARVQKLTDTVVGNKNVHAYQPRNIEEVQFSLPVQMALSVLGMGNGFKTHMDYLEGRLPLNPDSDVIKFARRIKMHYAPDLDEKYRNFVADVTVQYVDGTSEQIFRECWKGSSAIPFTREEHWIKLDELTEGVIGTKQAAELFGLIDRLDPTTPVGTITALLQRP